MTAGGLTFDKQAMAASIMDQILGRQPRRQDGVLPKAWLPNQAGFRFVAVLHDGRTQVCVVQRHGPDGTHYVRGVKYDSIAGWRHQ